MSADWTTCRVVRQEDAGLFFRTEDALVNAGGPTWRAQDGEPWTTRDLCELLPLVPVLDADGQPVVTTVGDLTAQHIGRRVRWDDGDEEGVLDFLGAERCRLECLADLDGRENPRTYGHWLPLDTPCEVLP